MRIKITVSDRDSSKSTTDFIELEDFDDLYAQVENAVDQIGYRKCDVELEAVDFEPTDEQMEMMDDACLG